MDFQRRGGKRSRWGVRLLLFAAFVASLVGLNLGVARWFPNLPTVDRRAIVTASVQRGSFVHEIRCVGQLVSNNVTLRSAETDARVAKILALPGVAVHADTPLLELANPELQMAEHDAKSKLGAAQAERRTQSAILSNELLQLEAEWRKLESEHAQAEATYHVSVDLFERNDKAISRQQLKLEKIQADSLLKQRDFAKQAFQQYEASRPDRLAIYDERVAQAQTELARARARVEALNVVAGVDGVLAQVPLEVGQQCVAGEMLAKIVDPSDLRAELRVAEVEARYVTVGNPVQVDTHHGFLAGVVTRIDPEVDQGSVTIDVSLNDAELPAELRPDLSVNGLVEVDRLDDVLWVGRPSAAMALADGDVFRCETTHRAVRVPVQFGIASTNTIVIESGLEEGDEVILSNMSDHDQHTQVILE